ncbi:MULTISPECIES: recombinase family protein [Bacillus cereus group]|uniref:recombinase family protein n=1 Tax=Bacillus cereus group TaxID=86661 RepID=UPI0030F37948
MGTFIDKIRLCSRIIITEGDTLVVTKLDRLVRNTKKDATIVENLFTSRGKV